MKSWRFWMTASGDRWFAKAFVNRLWSELVGHGFYEPVDDMGPDRQPVAPQAFEALTSAFMASHYDVKWLLRTITATAAYQRESRSRHETDQPALAASCPQRLRADQLFNVLCDALDIDEAATRAGGKEGGGPAAKKWKMAEGGQKKDGGGPGKFFAGPRGKVNRTFGYDPSTRRDEIAGSIPQALWMMNAPVVNRGASAHSAETMLGRLLDAAAGRQAGAGRLVSALPGPRAPAGRDGDLPGTPGIGPQSRQPAFEDILWALVNSTEFLNRK